MAADSDTGTGSKCVAHKKCSWFTRDHLLLARVFHQIRRPNPGCRRDFLERGWNPGQTGESGAGTKTNVCGCGRPRRRTAASANVPWPWLSGEAGGVGSAPMQPPAGSSGPGRTVLSKGRSKKAKAEFRARRCRRQPLRPNRSDPGPVIPGAGEAASSNRRWRKPQNRGALARRAAVDVRSANRLPFLDSVLPAHAMENFVKDLCPCPLAARGSHDEADAARTPFRFCDRPPRMASRPPGSVRKNRHEASPVETQRRRDLRNCLPTRSVRRALRARPNKQSTLLSSHRLPSRPAVSANDDLRPTPAFDDAHRFRPVRGPQPQTRHAAE